MVNARVERRRRATRERETPRRRGVSGRSRHTAPATRAFASPRDDGGDDGDDDDGDGDGDDDDAHRSRRRVVVARGELETFFDFDTEKRESAQPNDGATRDDER